MLKINNQDDCYLHNNVSNYQYGFLFSQLVPASLWVETLLVKPQPCHHLAVSVYSHRYHGSGWPEWQSWKNRAKKGQKEAKEGKGAHRTAKTNWRKEKRKMRTPSTSSLSLHGDGTTSWSPDVTQRSFTRVACTSRVTGVFYLYIFAEHIKLLNYSLT